MSKPIRNRRTATKLGQKLGKRVRTLRQRNGWSLEQLAERAGMHVTYLSSVERGYRNPTLNVIAAIAKALDISLGALVKGIEEEK